MYTFTIHKQVVEWGTLYHIMESNGNGYIRAYVYNDQPTILYLSDLSVSSNSRKQSLATTLLDFTSTIHDYNRVVLAVVGNISGTNDWDLLIMQNMKTNNWFG